MKKTVIILLSFIMLVSLLPIGVAEAAEGNTYYVSPDGLDSNPGTEKLPWATLAKAAQTLCAGDTAIFEDGTYNEKEYTEFINKGEKNAPITIKAKNKHKAVIMYDEALRLQKLRVYKSYINIEDFVITQKTASTADSPRPTLDILLDCGGKLLDVVGCEIIGNRFFNVYEEGIKLKFAKNILVKDNVIENPMHEGMDIFGCTDVIVCGNEISDCGRTGIMVKGNSRNCLVYNNYVFNSSVSCSQGYTIGGKSDASSPYLIAENVGYEAYNCVFYNNIAYSAVNGLIKTGFNFSGSIDCHAYNNISAGAANGFSFSCATDAAEGWGWDPPTVNPTLYNNIVIDATNAYNFIDMPSGIISDYNLFYNITNTSTIPNEENSIEADPRLLTNWQLGELSPARKAGTAIPEYVSGYSGIEGVDEIDIYKTVKINLVDFAGEERIMPWDMGVYNRGKKLTKALLEETFDSYSVGNLDKDNGGWVGAQSRYAEFSTVTVKEDEEDSDNKYVRVWKNGEPSSVVYAYKNFDNAPDGVSAGIVSLSLRLKQVTADSDLFYMHFMTPTTNSKDYLAFKFSTGQISTYWDIDETKGPWYDFEFIIDLDKKTCVAYCDGEKMSGKGEKAITNTTSLYGFSLSFDRKNGIGEFYVDDLYVYSIGDLDVLSIEPAQDGDLSKAIVTFNNNLSKDMLLADKILVNDGEVSVTSVEQLNGSKKQYLLTFAQALSPETTYNITFNGVSDLYGGELNGDVYRYKTRDRKFEFGDIILYKDYGTERQTEALNLTDGSITAAVNIVNERLAAVDAVLIMAHKRDGAIIDARVIDATVPKETEATKNVELTLSDIKENDTLEAYLWDGIRTMRALKPVKILSKSGTSELAVGNNELNAVTLNTTLSNVEEATATMTLTGIAEPNKSGTITAYAFRPGYSLDSLTIANFKNAVDFIGQDSTDEGGRYSLSYTMSGVSSGDEYSAYVGGNNINTQATDSVAFFSSDFLEDVVEVVNGATAKELEAMLRTDNPKPVIGSIILNTVLNLDLSDYNTLNDYTKTENYKTALLDELSKTEFESIEDIREKFYKETAKQIANQRRYIELLEKINEAVWSELYDIFADNNSLLCLNWEGSFAKLKDNKELREKLYKKLASITFKNLDELRKAFENEAGKLVFETGVKTSSGGGSGGITISKPSNSGSTLTPIVPPNVTEDKAVLFDDLSSVPWAVDAIEGLAYEGVVAGVADKKFEPDMKVTREQFVKMIVLAFDLYNEKAGASGFLDIGLGTWYEKYISSAVKCGIIQGVDSEHFGVGKEITRAEMAAVLYRAKEYLGKELAQSAETVEYADKTDIPEYAYKGIMEMTSAGIMSGVGYNMFAPNDKATRAMAAKVVWLLRGEG